MILFQAIQSNNRFAILTHTDFLTIRFGKQASTSCWDQLDKCYSTAPPTGSAGCKIWEAKCTKINDSCNAPSPKGPPDAGKYLGIPPPKYTIPPAQEGDIPLSNPVAHAPTPRSKVKINTIPDNPAPQAATHAPSSPQASKPTYPPSLNDRCGWMGNETSCVGSKYGRCCSVHCYCGDSIDHCGSGVCQPRFGECGGGEKQVRGIVEGILEARRWAWV